ncbi:hypothetical protein B0H14DRAFT_2882167 [Mycena olivaceomarginata]|nr:hypothetical protein B0H14DRAFT_2882167 [Mycena olivaceomarginata]
MAFAFLPFPYLRSYSLFTQFLILLVFVVLSYRYSRFRLALFAFLGIYGTYKVAVPLVRWGYAAFKGIAMFGFYVHFFVVGIGYIFTAVMGIWNSPELLQGLREGYERG